MKLLMLAPASVIHTQRWVEALHARGLDLALATQHDAEGWRPPAGVRLHRLPHSGLPGYFLNVPALRRLLRAERPELLNVHYASGYGSTAALSGFHPSVLSVWGSDVYDFPDQGPLQGWLLRRNLRRADLLASTSVAMAGQVARLLADGQAGKALRSPEVVITPFGIDTARFVPRAAGPSGAGLVIGCVKTLAPKYGVDVLLRGYAQLLALRGADAAMQGSRLVIVGGGPQRAELEALAAQLGRADRVQFVGQVPHAEVPRWLQGFDVYVAPSRLDSESFGVAVLEASACGLPVVVSDAGGLPEVVAHEETGLVVPREDPAALAAALQRLLAAPELRARMGQAGRARVLAQYEWGPSVDRMLAAYRQALAGRGRA